MTNEPNETTPVPDETGGGPNPGDADPSAQASGDANANPPEGATPSGADPTDGLDAEEVEKLLAGALEGYGDILAQVDAATATADASDAEDGSRTVPPMGAELIDQNLELLRDVHLQVKVELGRGRMYLKDILRLGQGSVVELERLAGDPLDIYVNDKVIARGEVLVLNESFCIRITEVFNPEVLRQAM